MEYFILSYTWCLLNTISKWLGIYPCERNEIASLKLTSSCVYWIRFIVMFALVLALVWISYLVIEDTSFAEMMTQVNRRILPKVTDKLTIGGNVITITCLS